MDGWIHRILENCEFLEATIIILSPEKLLLRILELINSMLILLKKRQSVIGKFFIKESLCPQTFHALVGVLIIYVCMRYSPQRCGGLIQ